MDSCRTESSPSDLAGTQRQSSSSRTQSPTTDTSQSSHLQPPTQGSAPASPYRAEHDQWSPTDSSLTAETTPSTAPLRHPRHGYAQPSYYDNQFTAEDSDAIIPRPRSPAVFVDTVNGERRPVGNEDYEQPPISARDADQSVAGTDFKDIITITDLGNGLWGPCRSQSQRSSKNPSVHDETDTQHHAEIEQPMSADISTEAPPLLHGVGSSFDGSAQGRNASTGDLNSYLGIEEAANRIREAYEKSADSTKQTFLPLDALCSIVNTADVVKILKQFYNDSKSKEYTHAVCGSQLSGTGRRKIFAILILIEKVNRIVDFIEPDIDDHHLPFQIEWNRDTRKYEAYIKGNDTLSGQLPCFNRWTVTDMEHFKDKQPYMLAPYLCIPDDKVFFYKIDQHVVLPFIEFKHDSESSFSRVSKVKIHRAHHCFGILKGAPDYNPYFAIKELTSTNKNDFHKEVEVLEKFSGANRPYPHLIKLLLAYQHGNNYRLLFAWADGNLKQFWSLYPQPDPSVTNARWVMTQCLGISIGLRKIHHASSDSWPKKGSEYLRPDRDAAKDWGRHSDMKPENILWFKDKHRLVISDFGLSRYHSRHSKSLDPHENLGGYSPTYRSPECDMQQSITQRYDIWALGCIFLQFASWYILGNAATDGDFSAARIADDIPLRTHVQEDKFFNIVPGSSPDEHRAAVKDSVKEWIRKIHDHESCPRFIHDLLDMVELYLLVPESRQRWECDHICRELDRIRDKCDSNDDYCTKPCSWPPTNRKLIGKLRQLERPEDQRQDPELPIHGRGNGNFSEENQQTALTTVDDPFRDGPSHYSGNSACSHHQTTVRFNVDVVNIQDGTRLRDEDGSLEAINNPDIDNNSSRRVTRVSEPPEMVAAESTQLTSWTSNDAGSGSSLAFTPMVTQQTTNDGLGASTLRDIPEDPGMNDEEVRLANKDVPPIHIVPPSRMATLSDPPPENVGSPNITRDSASHTTSAYDHESREPNDKSPNSNSVIGGAKEDVIEHQADGGEEQVGRRGVWRRWVKCFSCFCPGASP